MFASFVAVDNWQRRKWPRRHWLWWWTLRRQVEYASVGTWRLAERGVQQCRSVTAVCKAVTWRHAVPRDDDDEHDVTVSKCVVCQPHTFILQQRVIVCTARVIVSTGQRVIVWTARVIVSTGQRVIVWTARVIVSTMDSGSSSVCSR